MLWNSDSWETLNTKTVPAQSWFDPNSEVSLLFCPHTIVIPAEGLTLHNFMKYLLIKFVFYSILGFNICD